MNKKITHINSYLIIVSVILLLFVPFIKLRGLGAEVSIDKMIYINLIIGFLVLLSIASFYIRRKIYKLKIEDVIFILLILNVFFLYDYEVNLAPNKLIFVCIIFMLWFVLRFLFNFLNKKRESIIITMILVGVIETILGILQMFHIIPSNHNLFVLTGTFYNPGPYSGFLAMVLPLSISNVLEMNKYSNNETNKSKLKYNLFYFASVFLVFVIIIGMSRSAWIAAGISSLILYFIQSDNKVLKNINIKLRKVSRWKIVVMSIFSLIVFFVFVGGIYNLKKSSANGRLLMWKVTTTAIVDNPLGVGLGGFASSFASAQSKVLSQNNKMSDSMLNVAGSPEYAFNEYLHVGLEEGLLGLTLFLCFIIIILIKTYKNKRYGIFCSLISLSIFSFSSYPLQLPEFWVYFFILSAMGVSEMRIVDDSFKFKTYFHYISYLILLLIMFSSLYLIPKEKKYFDAYRTYSKYKYLYEYKEYNSIKEKYPPLYKYLSHRLDYLFEGAQTYSKIGDYNNSILWLRKASLLSSDPMIHYMLGKNYQAIGEYKKAEKELKYGISIIPERIYPYFLLTKLYSDSAYYHPVLLKGACDSVLYKKPKIMSPAIKEMRFNVKKMIKE